MKLIDHISSEGGLRDAHLLHHEIEVDTATNDIHISMFTEDGKKKFANVLSATVTRVYQGFYGLQLDLAGCKPSEVKELSYALAGYCSASDYVRWFNEEVINNF